MTETVSLLVSLNGWVSTVGDNKTIPAGNKKHDCVAAGGIEVINLLPWGGSREGSIPRPQEVL